MAESILRELGTAVAAVLEAGAHIVQEAGGTVTATCTGCLLIHTAAASLPLTGIFTGPCWRPWLSN